MTAQARLRIGTRASPLALKQTEIVRARLAAAHGLAPEDCEIVSMRTTGDTVRDRPLADAGGKGLFTKEIDEALLAGRIDLAVHSAKDVPTIMPDGLRIAACPPRADPRDAFVSPRANSLTTLAAGAVVGTASVRREALVRRMRPDLATALLRGNVETRLAKVANGDFAATVLALAGLARLDLAERVTEILDPETFPPSVGQGTIAVTVRTGDRRLEALLAAIDDVATSSALAAERAFLAELDGSCRSPIAGHATIAGDRLQFRGLVISHDGRQSAETIRKGSLRDATQLGADAGRELRARAPAGVLDGRN